MSSGGAAGPAARVGAARASVVSIRCFLRGLPLFFRAAPRTPLRVLGIIALDTLHVLRRSQPMTRRRVSELALFMDFEGCANAAWDHKTVCDTEHQAIRQRLETAGLRASLEAYLGRLRELESHRPQIGGDDRHFDAVRSYREAVARLSLAAATAIALGADLEDGIRATRCDSDVHTLFRILMQCQIIDDVLDYPADRSAGLPSFLTACASLPLAMKLTGKTARAYAGHLDRSPGGGVLPLRIALSVLSAGATSFVRAAHLWHCTLAAHPRPARTPAGGLGDGR